jgi:hypothetical protein
MATNPGPECSGSPHPAAVEGIRLFNRGEYFEAHEALEEAWRAEGGSVRELYRGILQIAVTCLHITRENYAGAVKVYGRSRKWLRDWPEVCRGIRVGQLRRDAEILMAEVQRLGPGRLASVDRSLMRGIEFADPAPPASSPDEERRGGKHVYICDRCGAEMLERNCKVSCPNCGNRFDCSDLNIYFD